MKKGRRNLILGIIFFILITMLPATSVQAAQADTWKTVKVACGINKSLYLDENGEPEGYCSEYLNQLAQINHWNIEYVEGSWTDSVQNLYDGKIDLLFPTQMTDDRKLTMGFSTAIGGYQPIGLYTRADSLLCYDDYEGFNGAKVALSKGTSNEAALQNYAQENGFTYEPVYLNTTEEKLQALKDGKADMIVFSTLNDVPNGKVVAMLDYLPFYYCTNISNTELLQELNDGMNQMLLRHPDIVENVFYNFMNKNISFAYTKEEQQEIDKHGKVVVGVYSDTAPLFDMDKDGNYVGIYVDLIKRIQEISGLDIEIRPLDRSEYAFDYLDKGNLDFIMGSSDQALKYSNKEGYKQSEGVMDYYSVNITRMDYSKTENDKQIFALTNGRRYWATTILEKYPNANIKYYESSKDCLNAVVNGKVDITILNSWEYNYQSKNQRFKDLMEWENSRTLSQTIFVSKEDTNPMIASVLDKAVEQISNNEKEEIITANLNRTYSTYSFQDRIYQARQTILVSICIIMIVIAGFIVYIIMRKKSLQELEEKNKQLVSANEAKDKFLSRMSHELRTPLNAISGYANVMLQDIDSNTEDKTNTRMHLEAILRASKYQLAIIGDLLEIQKIESGVFELVPFEVDAVGYMEHIVEMIQPEADEKNIQFSYHRLNKVNETYWIDGVRFEQVLVNVLHNAIKFTPAGGNVKMTAEVVDQNETANTIKFVISDNGIGMSEDFVHNYLFHRFAQEYEGNTSPYEGCGLGMAISRDILHLMGGEITCQSEKGIGTSFTIIITVKRINGRKKRTKTKSEIYDLTGIKVLLCEDNAMNQDMEKRILEKMHCEVDIADDGQIGVNKFQQSDEGYYDIVLMDIRMPNMDGLEATRKIRELNRSDAKRVPIVAVSANAFEEDVQKSLIAGMNEHLAKPVNASLLYKKIKEYSNYCPRNEVINGN